MLSYLCNIFCKNGLHYRTCAELFQLWQHKKYLCEVSCYVWLRRMTWVCGPLTGLWVKSVVVCDSDVWHESVAHWQVCEWSQLLCVTQTYDMSLWPIDRSVSEVSCCVWLRHMAWVRGRLTWCEALAAWPPRGSTQNRLWRRHARAYTVSKVGWVDVPSEWISIFVLKVKNIRTLCFATSVTVTASIEMRPINCTHTYTKS